MSNLYEITRKLVALGCPEPDIYFTLYSQTTAGFKSDCPPGGFWSAMQNREAALRLHGLTDHHARAIWEAHAREWAAAAGASLSYDWGTWTVYADGRPPSKGPDLLECIVAAAKSDK